MCYFISLAIKNSGSNKLEQKLSEGLHVGSNVNNSIKAKIPLDYDIFYITANNCSCDIISGDSLLRKDFINLVVEITKEIGDSYFLLHWYSGDINSENIYIGENANIQLNDFINPDRIVEEDILIHIINK